MPLSVPLIIVLPYQQWPALVDAFLSEEFSRPD